MVKFDIPLIFSQYDQRWANELLGFNTDPKYNFYNYGCTVCCLAMAACYYGKNINPKELNEKLKSKKGFVAGTGNYIYGSITKVFSDITETGTDTPMPLTDEQMGEIRTAIDNGHPVMLKIDYNPKTVALEMHFVLVVGYNPGDYNDLLIADPLGGLTRSLKDYLGWYRPNARKTIERYIIFNGPKPKYTGTLPVDKQVFEFLVHGSTQWDKSVNEYLPADTDPKVTQFEDLQRVVAGIKSRVTDLEKQLKTATENKAELEQIIKNKEQEISRLNKQLLDDEQTYKDRYNALKATIPDIDKIKGQLEGEIADLKADKKVMQNQIDALLIEISKLKSTEQKVALAKRLWLLLVKWLKNKYERFTKQR